MQCQVNNKKTQKGEQRTHKQPDRKDKYNIK